VLLPALEQVQPQVINSVPLLIEKIYRNLIAPKFERSRLLTLLRRVPVTRRMLHRFAGRKLRRTFGGKLKYFIVGGAALAEDVEKFLREAKFPLAIGYGLTETSPLVAGSTEEYAKPYTIGPAVAGVTIRVDSPDPEHVPGEVLVKGPNVMQGYYKNDERTREALEPDGWFHTGDLGVLDGEGYLAIRGRLKNMILGPSGENIYPESIEAVLNEYRFVNESVVFEQEGRLMAKVHLDYDALKEQMRDLAESAIGMSKDVSRIGGEYLSNLRKMVNRRLNAFSKLHTIFEQPEPFEKTPTKKIKRYKYTGDSSEPHTGTVDTAEKEDGNEKD
jgi:long-chain acyl-CoA synthetase